MNRGDHNEKFGKLSKKKSSILHGRISNHMIGDGTWQILQNGRQKQQPCSDQLQQKPKFSLATTQSPSAPDIMPKKKKKLKGVKSSLVNKSLGLKAPTEKLLKSTAKIVRNVEKQLPQHAKTQTQTLFKDITNNRKKDFYCNCNDEDVIEGKPEQFYEVIRKSVESGVKKAIELYMLRHFEGLSDQIEKITHWTKRMNSNYELLATELNNKVINYGEEHTRRLLQIYSKLEYDKLFYQNLIPTSNMVSNLKSKQLHYFKNESSRSSNHRTGGVSSSRRRRNFDRTPRNSQRTPKYFSPLTNQNTNSSDRSPSSDHKKFNHNNDDNTNSMTLEQILHAVGNMQSVIESSTKNNRPANGGAPKSAPAKHYYYSSTVTDDESHPSSDYDDDDDDDSSETPITYLRNANIEDSSITNIYSQK